MKCSICDKDNVILKCPSTKYGCCSLCLVKNFYHLFVDSNNLHEFLDSFSQKENIQQENIQQEKDQQQEDDDKYKIILTNDNINLLISLIRENKIKYHNFVNNYKRPFNPEYNKPRINFDKYLKNLYQKYKWDF